MRTFDLPLKNKSIYMMRPLNPLHDRTCWARWLDITIPTPEAYCFPSLLNHERYPGFNWCENINCALEGESLVSDKPMISILCKSRNVNNCCCLMVVDKP